MNAKEAKKIISEHDKHIQNIDGIPIFDGCDTLAARCFLEGFLEAVEKFKPVVEALQEIHKLTAPADALFGYIKPEHRTATIALESYCRDVLGE